MSLFGELLDPGTVDSDQRELSGDEETVGEYQEYDGRKA
jgi:hypothetical protein